MFRSHNIEIPSPGETKWYYRSRTIGVIFQKYEPLVNALEEIEEKPHSWDDSTVMQASGLLQYLNSFLFCFLLHLFNNILQQSSILYGILQNRSTDFSLGVGKVKDFANFLTELRSDAAFDELSRLTVDMVEQPSSRSDKKPNYKQLYFEILDTTITMLNDRFADCQSFAFLDLVNPYFFGAWKDSVPENKLKLLKEKYGSLFDMPTLKSQLLFMYKDADFHKESPMELMHYIYHYNLHPSLPEVVKLLKLNAVIAVSSASVEISFSCLRRVKTYLRSKMGQDRLSSLCRISIHKDILKEKEEQNQLHNLITEKFIEKPRRLDFLYK